MSIIQKHPVPWTIEECVNGDFEDFREFEINDANNNNLFCVKELSFAYDGKTGEARGLKGRKDAHALAQFIVNAINKAHQ